MTVSCVQCEVVGWLLFEASAWVTCPEADCVTVHTFLETVTDDVWLLERLWLRLC